MTAPVRIQLRRIKGWRMPPDTVKVSRPGRWGNPHRIGAWHRRSGTFMSADDVVEKFTDDLVCGRLVVSEADVRRELAGKNLACWCAPGLPCHADILLEIANRPVCEEVAA